MFHVEHWRCGGANVSRETLRTRQGRALLFFVLVRQTFWCAEKVGC
jgi:hypothetical protein